MQTQVKKTILLIEDGYWDAAAYVHHIREVGALVVHVETIEEAIEKLSSGKRYSGIISDVRKRLASGLEFIDWINESYPEHPPILFHSNEQYLREVDLDVLNYHDSQVVTFARKAILMRGDNERDYQYITDFINRLP